MKRRLETGFQIFEWENAETLCGEDLDRLMSAYEAKQGYEVPSMPMQVHEALIYHKVIEDPAVTGSGEECTWVSEKDWIYVCKVAMPEEMCRAETCLLRLEGVDTLADLYWNREKIASGEDVYLPLLADLVGKCGEENELVLHIHSPHAHLRQRNMPARYQGKIMPKWSLIRGFHRGYDDYLGFRPYLTRMGVYDQVWIEWGSQGIRQLDLKVSLGLRDTCERSGPRKGEPQILPAGPLEENIGYGEGCLTLFRDPEPGTVAVWELLFAGQCVQRRELEVSQKKIPLSFQVENPRLWNAAQKGVPHLYRLQVRLLVKGEEKDRITKPLGFRRIEKVGDFAFRVNGMPLRLWGANVAPLDNRTGCYQRERAEKIVKMALEAHMNCLRIWGSTDRLPDEFYELCDEAGLLLWQDFFHDYSMYPEEAEFRALCRREAEYQVRRLRHHPSILLWCGSNESIMCRDFSNPGEDCIGYRIYDEDYRAVCRELDPERYYHLSSPSGGSYANDPLAGDTHSYTSTWFVPGGRYPVFLSENMRAYPPVYHSMLRMLGEERLWPEGETGQTRKGNLFPWPESWRPFTSAESWQKISHVEEFYDACDAASMIYRFGASVGRYIEDCVGRYRRGRSYEQREESFRRCQGHLWWKMNTSAPHIYSGLLDYYMEPYIPYYALKRCYQPFQLFFSVDDYIGVWAVNDTAEKISGTIYVKLFHLRKNEAAGFFQVSFSAEPDQSVFAADLNCFGQFLMNQHVLYARAVDEEGKVLTEITGYADIERHMEFPDCTLSLSWEGEELVVETDCFARSVELLGEEEGDYFGWTFSDNYFDLLPGSIRRIRVGGHRRGRIHAKGYYGTRETIIDLP